MLLPLSLVAYWSVVTRDCGLETCLYIFLSKTLHSQGYWLLKYPRSSGRLPEKLLTAENEQNVFEFTKINPKSHI